MPLYFVEHKHTAETCPTQQPEMIKMLGQHVMQMTADKFGITIQSDVVFPGEHRLNLVLAGPSEAKIKEYVAPFGMVGTVEVREVSTCEEVVASAKC
jgi:hypothetical protein